MPEADNARIGQLHLKMRVEEIPSQGGFAPQATGALAAIVTIVDDAGNSPQTIALSGTGQ
jgi:hypothetical protein